MPLAAARGGAETMPELMATLRSAPGAVGRDPRSSPAIRTPGPPAESGSGTRPTAEIQTIHVQGNVHLIASTANIAVQVGDDGVVVVDTGSGQLTDKVLAAIKALSNKEIRWVINTEFDRDHAGGNEAISKAGRTVQR